MRTPCRAAVVACILFAHTAAAQQVAGDTATVFAPVVGPGDRSLVTNHFRNRRRDLRFEVLGPSGDSAVSSSALTTEERVISDGREPMIMLTFAYAAPFSTVDTLLVRQRDLRPERETLRTSNGVRRLVYEPKQVRVSVELTDSVPQGRTRPTSQQPFAFNEMEAVIRSLPLRPGYQVVLPLFSEMDELVERDTITVIGSLASRGGVQSESWMVRFADPAIVSIYTINVRTREVVAETVTQRRSGRRMRYVPAPAPC